MKKLVIFLVLLLSSSLTYAEASKSIKIGGLFAVSGWGAFGGESSMYGSTLAVEVINKSGGINNRNLELIVEDTASDPVKTLKAFQKLTEIDSVPIVIGPDFAEFIEITAPSANQTKVPFISPNGYKADVFKTNGFALSMFPPNKLAVKPLSEDIKQNNFKKIIPIVSRNAFFQTATDALRSNLKEIGIDMMPDVIVEASENDFRSLIIKLKSEKPDAVIVGLTENSGSIPAFFKQVSALKFSSHFYGLGENLQSDETLRKFLNLADGAKFDRYKKLGSEAFKARYKQKFNREADVSSVFAYDAVHAAAEAIKNCGIDPVKINSCLREINITGESGVVGFEGDGTSKNKKDCSELGVIRDGEIL